MAHRVEVGGRTFEVKSGEALVDFDVIDLNEARDAATKYGCRVFAVKEQGMNGWPWVVAIGLPGDLEALVIDFGIDVETPISPSQVE